MSFFRFFFAITGFESNNIAECASKTSMKFVHLCTLLSLGLTISTFAQTNREVVRDSSGGLVQTIERRIEPNGQITSTTRDAAGRLIQESTTQVSPCGRATTQYRDSGGRLIGTAQSQALGVTQKTQFRDASGRLTGTSTSRQSSRQSIQTQLRDSSGRLAGQSQTYQSGRTFSTEQRDATGRLTIKSQGFGLVPDRPPVHPNAQKR